MPKHQALYSQKRSSIPNVNRKHLQHSKTGGVVQASGLKQSWTIGLQQLHLNGGTYVTPSDIRKPGADTRKSRARSVFSELLMRSG